MIGFIKCYFAMKMQRFRTEHSNALCREGTARIQNATQTGRVFITEVIPRPKCCCGRMNPGFYLGKDKVGCGNTASLIRGGPAARTRQMGQILSGGTVVDSKILKLRKGTFKGNDWV